MIFILGSNSFAGSVVVDHLLSFEKQVIGISRSPESHSVLQPYFNNPNKKYFKFYQYDLNDHHDEIINLIKKNKPAVIVDFAGQGMVAESWHNPVQWYKTNIVSKVKLHQFLKDCDFLDRYIRVSTPEVYGSITGCADENHTLNPSTPYAVSHAAIDMSLLAFYKQHQFPVILTRFANFYGPHQQLYRIIPRTIIYALMEKKLPLHGGGFAERMFIYKNDIASAVDAVIERGQVGELYHFAHSPCVSIRVLVEEICRLMQLEPASLIENVEDRPGKDNKYELDIKKAKKELNWEPSYSLVDGLSKTIEWVKKNIDSISALPLVYQHKP